VYVKNESPPGTAASNASSLIFDLSPSFVLVAPPVCPRAQCTVNGNTVIVNNISPPIQAKEVYPITLQVNTCVVVNEGFITNLNVFTGSQVFNGQPFTPYVNDATFQFSQKLSTRGTAYPIDFTTTTAPVVTGISCGNIACGQSFSVGNEDPTSASYKSVSGWRGLNADGTCSGTAHLSYFVTNQLGAATTTDRLLHFTWQSDLNSPQTFAYELTRIPATGQWTLGWLLDNSGQLVTIPAPLCNGALLPLTPTTIDDLPLPKVYGVLTSDVKANTKTLKVDTLGNTPPTVTGAGIPIIVETERMLVTAIDNSGWSVSRTATLSHPAGTNVASTPMPLLDNSVPSPYGGSPAKMCLAWTSGGTATTGTSAWVIDQSDGWTLGR
jgi:hypothetical protein